MSGSDMEVDPDSSNESNDETSEAAVDGEAVVAEVNEGSDDDDEGTIEVAEDDATDHVAMTTTTAVSWRITACRAPQDWSA